MDGAATGVLLPAAPCLLHANARRWFLWSPFQTVGLSSFWGFSFVHFLALLSRDTSMRTYFVSFRENVLNPAQLVVGCLFVCF